MRSVGEQDNAKRGKWRQGGADENACKWKVHAGMRNTCRAGRHARREGKKEEEREKGRKRRED